MKKLEFANLVDAELTTISDVLFIECIPHPEF